MITYFLIFLLIIAIILILVITDKIRLQKRPEKEPYLADWYKYPQCRCKGYQMI